MSESKIRDYKDLLVWQKGIALAKEVYAVTSRFPSEEKFGLISQMRRAAVSVPSNIAEGHARSTRGEYLQFLSHAEGSLAELDTQVRIAKELAYCSSEDSSLLSAQILELQKMLKSLRAKLTV